MKAENMKLLDLQTGKYLEFGEEGFFYGGKTITCPPTKSFDIQNVKRDMTLHIYADTEKDYDIKRLDDSLCPLFEITCKPNNQKLIGSEIGHIDMRFNRFIEQTEPPLELKEICEKVGAVVYGGRYVLIENEYCGDVLFVKDRFDYWNEFYSVCKSDGTLTNQRLGDWITKVIGNLFEEYSKQLRKEESKFDELMEKLK